MSASAVAIIGAGISGLSCARALVAAGREVVIFEKSRSLGGRCASRKWEGHIVDHGAQYFTLRDADFRAEVERICGADLRTLTAPVVDQTGTPLAASDPRCYHAAGNNRLGKALRGDLPVRLETTIVALELRPTGWELNGELFAAAVSSAPWPQTLALLGREPGPEIFAPCLTAFFSYRGVWAGQSQAAYARSAAADSLAWSACENHKLGRIAGAETVFVAQASPEFSREYLESDPALWSQLLQLRLEAYWQLEAGDRLATFTHRWRYARCVQTPELGGVPRGFFMAGDARTASRVEAAWLAGREAAREVLAAE